MGDILHRELIDNGQSCYCMIAAVSEPYVYLRAKGKVLHRWIQGDNVGYYIHIQEILEEYVLLVVIDNNYNIDNCNGIKEFLNLNISLPTNRAL